MREPRDHYCGPHGGRLAEGDPSCETCALAFEPRTEAEAEAARRLVKFPRPVPPPSTASLGKCVECGAYTGAQDAAGEWSCSVHRRPPPRPSDPPGAWVQGWTGFGVLAIVVVVPWVVGVAVMVNLVLGGVL